MSDERYELPERWVWAGIGEVAAIAAGNPAPQGGQYFEKGKHHFVRVQDMGRLAGNMFVDETRDLINDKAVDECRLRQFPQGTVLFTKSGMSTLLNQRAVLRRPAYVVSHIGCAVPNNAAVTTEWLYYALRQVDLGVLTQATTLPSLKLSTVVEVQIPLAPFPEQRRIVAKIAALFEQSRTARQSLDRTPPLLKKFHQSVLAAAFRGDLTRDWREQHPDVEPASALLERIRAERRRRYQEEAREAKAKGRRPPRKPDNIEPAKLDPSGLRALPNSWQWATINDLSDGSRGITYGVIKLGSHYDRGIPTLRSSDVKWLHINLSSAKRIKPEIANRYRRTFLSGGEVLVSVRGTLGGVACVPSACKGFNVSREIAVVAPVPEMNAEWLTYVIGSPEIQNVLTAVARGVAYTGVNIEDLKQIVIPVPPPSEQVQIVARIEALLTRADAIEAALQAARRRAETLDQSILARAFRGELVLQDPNDEPASLLLERIRAEPIRSGARRRPTVSHRKGEKHQNRSTVADV